MSSENSERYTPFVDDPFKSYIAAYVDHLRKVGKGESQIQKLRDAGNRFLVWLRQKGIRLEGVDDSVIRRYRDRCRKNSGSGNGCAKASRVMVSMTGARGLVRFLEGIGRIRHPGELDDGLRRLEQFIGQRAAIGYRDRTLQQYRYACVHFLNWLHQCRIPMARTNPALLDRFLDHDCVCLGPTRRLKRRGSRYRNHIRCFADFLYTRGEMPSMRPAKAVRPRLPAFEDWLHRHRGIAQTTMRKYVRTVSLFLPHLGSDPAAYDAALIRSVMLRRFADTSPGYAREMTKAMRMYLRFLSTVGQCAPELVAAVPTARQWQLDALPRYVPAADIERLIASCDRSRAVGIRDRAILLLLARLALRAGDVVKLRLTDIDWNHALLTFAGKSRQAVRLPMPQDVGDAILSYVENARPRVEEERLFLRAMAPHRPLSSSNAITHIVCRALERAGMHEARPRGAYLFRHSAATEMLRSGASLETVGTLLRHRLPNTTAIYAKVDVPMLLEVAQPWIGGEQWT